MCIKKTTKSGLQSHLRSILLILPDSKAIFLVWRLPPARSSRSQSRDFSRGSVAKGQSPPIPARPDTSSKEFGCISPSPSFLSSLDAFPFCPTSRDFRPKNLSASFLPSPGPPRKDLRGGSPPG